MKIAIFTDTFLPKIDGVVTATLNLSKGLADKGHKVFIICPKYSFMEKEFSYKNIEIIRIRGIPAFFYPDLKFTSFFSFKLLNKLKKEKIDIIHFQTPLTLSFEAILISSVLGVPLVGTFHTFFGDPNYLKHAKLNYKFCENFAWEISRFYYNKCDLITCPSETTRLALIEHGHSKPIKVISNGVDFKMFDNSLSKTIKEKYNKNGPLLLFVGRIAHEKNISYLIDCFNLVLKKVPNVKLLIVGDGPQMEDVKEKIKEEGLEKSILMLGKIIHSDFVKSGIFGAVDVFVSASITENQPMTVLEAQANGIPCVVINERGMKDLIIDNNNGFLVENNNKKEFADRVVEILKNDKLQERMKKNTFKLVQKQDLKEIIGIWEDEYLNLVNKNKICAVL